MRRFTDDFLLWLYVLMVIDTMGLPLPSEVPLLYGGFLASQDKVEIAPAGVLAAAGAVTGSMLAYTVSRRFGRAAILRWGRRIMITEHHLHRAEAWFERRGQAAVFICRMIPLARTLISIPAGIAEMPPARFAAYSFAGSIPWSYGLLAGGWVIGENWDTVLGQFTIASAVIGAIIVAAGVVWWARRRRERAAAER